MTDETQGQGAGQATDGGANPAYDPIAAARAKLEEVKTENSLPADVIVVLEEGLNSQSALRDGLANLAGAAEDAYGRSEARIDSLAGELANFRTAQGNENGALAEDLAAVATRLSAVEARGPAQQISAEGFDLTPAANAYALIQTARENSAIPGTTATILENILAALGVTAPPPAAAQPTGDAQQGADAAAETAADPATPEQPAANSTEQPAGAETPAAEEPTGGQ